MKKELLNHIFKLDIQLFSGENENQDENENHESQDENKNNENKDKNDKEKISLSPSQLEERLKRERDKERQKVESEYEEKTKEIISSALKEYDEIKKKEEEKRKSFENMTEEQRKEEEIKQKEQELADREQKLANQLNEIEIAKSKDIIVNQYDEDNLPRRDIFSTNIAPFIATLKEEDKINVYNAIRDIIEDTKASVLKENMKQNPPKNGDGNNSEYASNRFVNYQNEKRNRTKYNK